MVTTGGAAPQQQRPARGGRRGRGGRVGGDAAPRPERPDRAARARREEAEESGLIERVVQIRRVAKVVKGGRHLTFNAMVVVGDGTGQVGASLGKAGAVPDAVRKGSQNARKTMRPITLNGTTIPHEVSAKFGACKVLLRPASPGTGIKAGGGVRAVLEAVGVRDVLSKAHGSRNTINLVKATLLALSMLKEAKAAIAVRRGEQPAGA